MNKKLNQSNNNESNDIVLERETPSKVSSHATGNNTSDTEEPEVLKNLRKKMEEMLEGDMEQDESIDNIVKDIPEEEKQLLYQISQEIEKMLSFPNKNSSNLADKANSNLPPTPHNTPQSSSQESEKKQKELDDIITETLSKLNKDPEEWKQESLKETTENKEKTELESDAIIKDMLKLFTNENENENNPEKANDEKMFGILENMMQSFLDPQIILEPMNKLVLHYPKWLKENKGVVDDETYNKCLKQYEYAKQIVEVYRTKKYPDCMEEVMVLLGGMQEYGQPPKDLVGELTNDDEESPSIPSIPTNLPGGPGQCPVQ